MIIVLLSCYKLIRRKKNMNLNVIIFYLTNIEIIVLLKKEKEKLDKKPKKMKNNRIFASTLINIM
jgi:hypothetical protein